MKTERHQQAVEQLETPVRRSSYIFTEQLVPNAGKSYLVAFGPFKSAMI